MAAARNPGPGARLAGARASGAARLCALFLMGTTLCRPATAQVVRLVCAPPRVLALGDTLGAEVQVRTEGRLLTSAGVALAYDPDVLAPVPARRLDDGLPQPFDPVAAFLPGGVVYENAARAVGPGVARARFVIVAGAAAGGERTPAAADGAMARIRFAVVGPADSAVVALVWAGRDRPVFTELGRPGVEGGFRVDEPTRFAVPVRGGLLPLPPLEVEAGRRAAIALRRHAPGPGLTWTARSLAPEIVVAAVVADTLVLTTAPRRGGAAIVAYDARDAAGAVVAAGQFEVAVRAVARLVDPGIRFAEDAPAQRVPLSVFLGPAGGDAGAWTWEAESGAPVDCAVDAAAAALSLSAPADWSGAADLVLRLRADRDLVDSLTVVIAVTPVNDPPRLRQPGVSLQATVGARTPGPALADLAADSDDAFADLRFSAAGDAGVEAWIADGHVQLRGLRPGAATATLGVADPAGAAAALELAVAVAAPGVAPTVGDWPDLRLQTGTSLARPVSELVADGDSPAVQVAVVGDGAVVGAAVDGDLLRITALGPGDGWIRLTATDAQGNEASVVWPVAVAAPEALQPAEATGAVAPEGDAAAVAAPQRVASDGTTPVGVAPEVVASAGVSPVGVEPEVTIPEGVAAAGAAPEVVVAEGVEAEVAAPEVDVAEGVEADVAVPDDVAEGAAGAGVAPEFGVPEGVEAKGATPEAGVPEGSAPEVDGPEVGEPAADAVAQDLAWLEGPDAQTVPDADELEPAVTAAPAAPFAFAPLPRIGLVAGQETLLDLAEYLEPAGSGRAYTLAGVTFLAADLDGDAGRLRLAAPAGAEGREILLLGAVDGGGRRAVATLDVLVRTDAPGALRLGPLPSLRLAAGDSTRLELTPFAAGAGPDLAWSATATSDLVAARVEGDALWLRAAEGVSGRTTLLVSVRDAEGRVAGELLPVAVSGHADGPAAPVRVDAPPDLALAPGDSAVVELSRLVAEGAAVSWHLLDGGGVAHLAGPDALVVAPAADAQAGWRTVVIGVGSGPGATVRLSFGVAVAAAARLVLRPAAERVLVAGRVDDGLRLDSLVAVGAPEGVDWRVADGGLRVRAAIAGDRRLRLDASDGLPGREVFSLDASLGGETRRLSVPVRVRAPRVTVAVPGAGIAAAGDTSLAIDDWVRGELAAAQIAWWVEAVPQGIDAAFDTATRRLALSGRGAGRVRLTGRLPSGLQVAAADLTVAVGTQTPPPQQPPPGEAPPEEAPPEARPPEEQTPLDAAARAPWTLRSPPLVPLAPGGELRLPLADLLQGIEPSALAWTLRVGHGWAHIEGEVLVVGGATGFEVALEAVAADGARQALTLTAAAAPVADPLYLELAAALTRGADGAPALRLTVASDADAQVRLRVNGGTWTGPPTQDRVWVLPLPAGPQPFRIDVQALRGGAATGADLNASAAAFADAGGALTSPDGRFVATVPAGVGDVALLLTQDAGAGQYRVERSGGGRLALGLFLADEDGLWSGLEERAGETWRPVPGARRTVAPTGIAGYADPGTSAAAYRAAAAGVPAALAPQPFPNPFNATVTLPVGAAGPVRVEILDSAGRRLRLLTLPGGLPGQGVVWDGRDDAGRAVASGFYLYRVAPAGYAPRTGKLTLLR